MTSAVNANDAILDSLVCRVSPQRVRRDQRHQQSQFQTGDQEPRPNDQRLWQHRLQRDRDQHRDRRGDPCFTAFASARVMGGSRRRWIG